MAVTVTYQYPVIGTTAPTAAQAALANTVTAQVGMGDTDVSAVITHNWGLTAAENTALFPSVSFVVQTAGTLTPLVSFTLGTNSVTLTKASATGNGGTYIVALSRPHTFVR